MSTRNSNWLAVAGITLAVVATILMASGCTYTSSLIRDRGYVAEYPPSLILQPPTECYDA